MSKKPGCLDLIFRGKIPEMQRRRTCRDARLGLMPAQNHDVYVDATALSRRLQVSSSGYRSSFKGSCKVCEKDEVPPKIGTSGAQEDRTLSRVHTKMVLHSDL